MKASQGEVKKWHEKRRLILEKKISVTASGLYQRVQLCKCVANSLNRKIWVVEYLNLVLLLLEGLLW